MKYKLVIALELVASPICVFAQFQSKSKASVVLGNKFRTHCKNGFIDTSISEKNKHEILGSLNVATQKDWVKFTRSKSWHTDELEECLEDCERADDWQDFLGNGYEEQREDFEENKRDTKPLAMCRKCIGNVPCTTKPPPKTRVSNDEPDCGRAQFKRRVFNGEDAKKNSWPWQISLRTKRNGRVFCGGVLLNQDWILTAAHCVTDYTGSSSNPPHPVTELTGIHIAVGFHENDKTGKTISKEDRDAGAQYVGVKQVIVHTGWSVITKHHDIALAMMARSVRYPKSASIVMPACLPSSDFENSLLKRGPKQGSDEPTECHITGWGRTERRSKSRILQEAQLYTISTAKCESLIEGEFKGVDIIDKQICAYDEGKRTDTCQGDSGGPLHCALASNEYGWRFAIHGITSYGFSCGQGFPGIYTRVSQYTDWIKSTVAEHSKVDHGVQILK